MDPLSDATIEHYSARRSLDDLKKRHEQEWSRLWQSGFEFTGNLPLAQVRGHRIRDINAHLPVIQGGQ